MIEGFCFHCFNVLYYKTTKQFSRFNGNVLMVKCTQCNNFNSFSPKCIPLEMGNFQYFEDTVIDF